MEAQGDRVELFISNQAVVKRLRQSGALATFSRRGINVDPEISFLEHKAIVTGLNVAEACVSSIRPSFGKLVYVSTFDDDIGQVQINGISVGADCDGGGESHGLAETRRYYHENKLSARKDPIKVVFGGTTEVLSLYLLRWQGGMTDPETRLFPWAMQFALIPYTS